MLFAIAIAICDDDDIVVLLSSMRGLCCAIQQAQV
jgi:hypothetical protein